MILFGALLLAHLLYDFHWQGDFIARMKGERWFILWVHALTWALLLGAVLYGFHSLSWWMVPFLAVTHAATDRWKAQLPKTPEWFWAIYGDQGIHLATVVVVVAVR